MQHAKQAYPSLLPLQALEEAGTLSSSPQRSFGLGGHGTARVARRAHVHATHAQLLQGAREEGREGRKGGKQAEVRRDGNGMKEQRTDWATVAYEPPANEPGRTDAATHHQCLADVDASAAEAVRGQ